MKKRIVFCGLLLIPAIVVYVVVSLHISKLSNDIDENKQDENSKMAGCIVRNIRDAKVVSVDGDNRLTVMLREDISFSDEQDNSGKEVRRDYKKGDTVQINGDNFMPPEELENDKFKYIDKSIKQSDDYDYLPWSGDKIHIMYIDPHDGIESPSEIFVTEYGARITGTVLSTRVLMRKQVSEEDIKTGNARTQECATIKISDISCEQECTFKKDDIVEVMYGGVYIDGAEQEDRVLQEGDTISYGFGRHDSERYGEYEKEDTYVMTPLRVDLESEKAK